MKFGVRTPSLKRRIAARTSVKRYVRHSMGLKAPRGYGWVTNPKRAAYNRAYNRTSVSVNRLLKTSRHKPRQGVAVQRQRSVQPESLQRIGISYRPAQLGGFAKLAALMSSDPKAKARIKVSDAMRQLNFDKYEAALALAEEAQSLDPDNLNSYFVLALCSNNLGRNQEALDAATRFLQYFPDVQEMLLVYATANFNLHNYEKSLEALAEMTSEAQQNLLTLKVKALCFYNLKRYNEAVETLKQAPLRIRNLTPALIEIHYWLARALEAEGKKKDAIKHYEKISAAQFGYDDVQERLSALHGN